MTYRNWHKSRSNKVKREPCKLSVSTFDLNLEITTLFFTRDTDDKGLSFQLTKKDLVQLTETLSTYLQNFD